MKRRLTVLAVILAIGTGLLARAAEEGAAPSAPAEPSAAALERTRKSVRMLDDVYKSVIVLITDKYVQDEDDFPAGRAEVHLFGEITKKGWHEVRLIDATGEPYEPANVARDDFEKRAVEELKSGKDYVEKVVSSDGKPYLRAVTPVPVVMQKCIMCHAHYADGEKGKPSGAITYKLLID